MNGDSDSDNDNEEEDDKPLFSFGVKQRSISRSGGLMGQSVRYLRARVSSRVKTGTRGRGATV